MKGFGNIETGKWYGVTVGFNSSKSYKGIMRLLSFDQSQDMLIFERSENVGYSGTSTQVLHVFLPEVSMISITPMDAPSYDREVYEINQNPMAIAWMQEKTRRDTEDDSSPKYPKYPQYHKG